MKALDLLKVIKDDIDSFNLSEISDLKLNGMKTTADGKIKFILLTRNMEVMGYDQVYVVNMTGTLCQVGSLTVFAMWN